jgi:hypothetical protein
MSDQTKDVARPWRRFLRFSVRGMIVLVMVVGGWLGRVSLEGILGQDQEDEF